MPVSEISEERGVAFYEGEFLVKTLDTKEELTQAYQLRHRVFAEKLGWVPPTEDGQEMDMYDLWGVTIGVLDHDGTLLGMARLLPSSGKFMLENEFGALLPGDYTIRKEQDTAEITRLAVNPDIQDAKLSTQVMLGTLKGIYQWAVENEIRYYYLEVEHRFLRALRMLGFPCEPIGPVVKLPPAGAGAVAALYDMARFDNENMEKRPGFLEWISTIKTTTGQTITGRTLSVSPLLLEVG
ncbi:MAG: N-acyl-L-homoserine lactone synthetase [Candidatus Nitrospira kreftii]|uniref:N-acyl-L-homoserine lactone synthetase n=1 Tax=Candidatus Nitrospira kreftii TaxID=2652173 RepID=A0A7S8J194_9BACT|nr:MAG: N-acyl-L-homoserine lactone synthetase [Candidatus Nitrospira kreftii]